MITPTLIFLHILKTGGTTLNVILENYFPHKRSFATFPTRQHPEGSLAAFRALSDQQKAQIDLLNGHMGFGLHEELPRTAVYITLLRDPVERVISRYNQMRHNPQSHLHQEIVTNNMSVKDFVRWFAAEHYMDNLQTRMIAGNWDERGFGPCTDEMLATAKQNLQSHFIVAGLTERFDETYLLLKRHFGWPYVPYTRHNVGHNRPEIDAETRDLIRQYNSYDMALYAFVRERLAVQIRQQGLGFQLELRWLRLRNWWHFFYGTQRHKYWPCIRHAYLKVRYFSVRVFVRRCQAWLRHGR